MLSGVGGIAPKPQNIVDLILGKRKSGRHVCCAIRFVYPLDLLFLGGEQVQGKLFVCAYFREIRLCFRFLTG